MRYIDSDDNKMFKEICKLKNKKYRYANRSYLIEGVKFVREALSNDCNIKYLVIDESKKNSLYEIFDLSVWNPRIIVLHKTLFSKIKQTENTQGIIAVVKMDDPCLNFDFSKGAYFLIDKIQDPGNLGTIIRTAVAVGALGVIIIKGTVDIYNDKVLRSTMGSVFKTTIYMMENYCFLDQFVKNDFKIFLTDPKSKNIYYDENLTGKIIIAVGNEAIGVSDNVKEFMYKDISIPMCNNFDSLNVAQALSIVAFEYLRQTNR